MSQNLKPGRDAAVGQVITFIAAGAIFLAAMGALLYRAQVAGGDDEGVRGAAQDSDADAIAELLTASPGAGWDDPDSLERFGLAEPGGGLDAAHVALLTPGDAPIADNGFVEYAEAKASLGLPAQSGFHLRIVPLPGGTGSTTPNLDHVHALYIGDWTSIATITLPPAGATIANANVQLNLTMASGTALERDAIQASGIAFDNQVHLTLGAPTILVDLPWPLPDTPLLTVLGLTLWDGDVLFDNKQYLDAVLEGKLESGAYDLLVIGSGIDHSTLTSNHVKGAIEDFVRDGGTLMVFGASGNNFQWLQPLFSVASVTASGPLAATDPGHAALNLPWALDWDSYPTQDLAWDVGDPSDFDVIVTQGGQEVLAISDPGAFDDGHVFLTSVKPRLVSQTLGAAEATHFITNLLKYQYAPEVLDGNLDFGPDPPSGTAVSSAVRTTTLQGEGGSIPVRVELLVWATP